MMRKPTWLRSILLGCLGILCLVLPVLAMPPLPSSFWGTVTLNSGNVPDGTLVQASIGGKVYAETHTSTYGGRSAYALNVPGDDPATPEIEGGVEGDIVHFTVNGTPVSQSGTWQSGTNVRDDLADRAYRLWLPYVDKSH